MNTVSATKPRAPDIQMDFIGYISLVRSGKNRAILSGWIKSILTNDPVTANIRVNGIEVAHNAIACLYSDDLHRAGMGTGHHAILKTCDLSAGVAGVVTVELCDVATNAVLLSQTVHLAVSDDAGQAKVYGSIDTFDHRGLHGWVKQDGRDAALAVDVLVDGAIVAQNVVADMFRVDLRQAGIGGGHHAFHVPLNPMVQDNDIVVEVRDSATRQMVLQRALRPRKPAVQPLVPPVSVAPVRRASADMKCDIRLELAQDNLIKGWAVDTREPARTFDIEILIDGFLLQTVRNDRSRKDLERAGKSKGRGGYQAALDFGVLDTGEHEVMCRTPDGRTAVKTITTINTTKISPPVMGEAADRATIAVVVPVYNAAEDLAVCIDRLAAYTPANVDILFIDDCSPDPEIARILATVGQRHPGMRAMKNEKNLGFSGTINRGIAQTGTADVITLNSDARVTPQWTEGMWYAVYSSPMIGTATAMSDRAGAFSAPRMGNDNPLPPGTDEVSFARAFRRASRGLYPRVPTGNGFCMYIRRACIDAVGTLDQVAFPKGYGEENDFCMRALRAGWAHVIDDRTYVFHDRSKSFGASKTDLMAAGRAIVDQRYPEYSTAISVFRNDETIALSRMGAHCAARDILAGKAGRTRVLFVIATQTGGTPQTNGDLMRAFDGNIEGWTLRCNSKMLELCLLDGDSYTVVAQHTFTEPVSPTTHSSSEYDRVVQHWLFSYGFDLVHIRHLAWHSINLPAIAKRVGLPVVFSFHDFYMLSPTIKMIDDAGVYLGDHFTPAGRERRESLWPLGSQPDPTGEWLKFWQERNMKALSHCDAFITTSNSARELILKHLPTLPAERFAVIPHGRDFERYQRLGVPYDDMNKPLRILLPGNINEAKGLRIILQLLEHDVAGRLEFHVLGNIRSNKGHPRLVLHGPYKRDEFAARVAALNVNAGAIFSIWDETYCHTLTEMWSVGISAVVFDFANIADRVRTTGGGWVVDHSDIATLYDQIVNNLCDPAQQRQKAQAVSEWQTGYGLANGTREMASHYLAIYRDLLRDRSRVPGTGTKARIAVVCLANQAQREAAGSTIVRVWERCRNSIDRDVTFIRMSPSALIPAAKLGFIDGAIIQRTAIPLDLVSPVLDTLKQHDIPYVYEIDDDLLNVPQEKDPKGIYANYASALRDLLTSARMVTVSTKPLIKAFAPYTDNITLLPNRLSDRLWTRTPSTLRKPDGTKRALYMGTKTHDEDLRMILPALDEMAKRDDKFRCALIGITGGTDVLSGRERWLEIIDISNATKTYDRFVPWVLEQAWRFDFGLAPLVDRSFNKTKSALKLLDYAGMGLPVLASDVDVYRAAGASVDHVTLVPNTVQDWAAALSKACTQSPRSDIVDAQRHDFVQDNHMLGETLADFDQMLLRALVK